MASSSNACIPVAYPVVTQVPPLPNTVRGEPCNLDGQSGRISAGKSFLSYVSGKVAVIRSLKEGENLPNSESPILVYRGHQYATSCVKVSTSGAYACSGDTRGKIRVWAIDHEEHLCKLEQQALGSTVRDISWDGESKRIAYAGDRLDSQSVCTRIIQWDAGNTQGDLTQHLKGKSWSVAFKPNRPFRLATAGKEDGKIHFHKGPPFKKVIVEDDKPCEQAHSKGINCIRYTSDGALVASVGGDKSLCIYDGKELGLKSQLKDIHTGTIYACAWANDNKSLITSSADGTCKLFEVSSDGTSVTEKHVWKVAEHMLGGKADKAPRGGMQLGCAFAGGITPVSVSFNNQISVLPMPGSGGKIEILTGHSAPIGAVAFDHSKGVFYTGDSDGIICKWDLKEIKALERIVPPNDKDISYQVHKGAINAMTVLKDSQLLSCGWDDTGRYTKSDKLQSETLDITAQPVAIATGTSLTAVLTVKGVMLLKNGKQSSSGILPLSYDGNCIAVSKDDKTIYVGGNDCKIYVYSADLKEKHVISENLKPIHSLALSNNGTMLASSDTRDVCVFKTSDYSVVVPKATFCFHLQKIEALAWSPDDKVLASGGNDDSIIIWGIEKKRRVAYKYAHRGGVVALAFKTDTPGKYTLVSAGKDSCIVSWDVTADAKKKFGL